MGTRSRRARRFVALAVVQVAVLVAGVAFAEWLASGTGSGYAKARRAVPLTTTEASPAETLYPGAVGDAIVTIANANPYPVTAQGVAGNGPITSGVEECDGPGNGVSFEDQTGAWVVPANGSTTVTLTMAVAMAATSPDACQGATFAIPVRITGQSGAVATTTTSTSTTSTTLAGQPSMAVAPTSHAFGSVPAGQSAMRTFVFTNTGTAVATNPTPQVSGPAFSIAASTCGAPLSPSASCNVDVRFAPTSPGSFSGQVAVSGTGFGASAQLTGTSPTPAQLSMPSQMPFPTVTVGENVTQPINVTNTGGTATGPLAISYTGPNAGDFSTTSTTCGSPVAPGGSCSITIRFAPSGAGTRSATVNVFNTTGPGSAGSNLNGQGITP